MALRPTNNMQFNIPCMFLKPKFRIDSLQSTYLNLIKIQEELIQRMISELGVSGSSVYNVGFERKD